MASSFIFKGLLKHFKFKPVRNCGSFPSFIYNYRSSASIADLYKPYSIQRAIQSTPETLRIEFKDSSAADFYYVWLRDSCSCTKCVNPATKQKMLDTVTLTMNITPRFCHVNDKGELKIIWLERDCEHSSYYDPLWLHKYALGFERNLYEAMHDCLPPIECWTGNQFNENLVEIKYEDVMQTQRGISRCLENVHKYGILVLRNVPCEPGEVVKVMNRIAHIKDTRWGSSFHIITDALNDPPCLPLCTKCQELHTDMDYLEKSPGILAIHCLEAVSKNESDCEDENLSKSYFVDGFYVAKWLKKNYPLFFETLASVPVRFKISSKNMEYSNYQPVLRLNRSRDVTEVHFNNKMMAPLEGPQSSIFNFYMAYKLFGESIRSKENQFCMLVKPGDMVIINNRRVLHGRSCSASKYVTRHIEGCYADMDEVTARYRSFLERKAVMEA